jgi:hypothetical protein
MLKSFSLRVAELAAIASAGLSLLPAAASASSLGTPFPIDSPGNGNPPLIAYDARDQVTYVAWTAPSDGGIEVCVLPSDATSCAGGGPVVLTDVPDGLTGDAAPQIAGLVVEPGASGEVVVLGSTAKAAVGTIAWASAEGGGGFALQNGGAPISPVSLYYTTNNAVGLSSSDVGLFDSYDHGNPGGFFSDSPAAGPESPAIASSNANNGDQFGDEGFERGGVLAAEPAPAPAPAGTEIVVGAGQNTSTLQHTQAGCANYAATGYGVTVGAVNGTSDASGTLNGDGLQSSGFGLLACSAESPVLASGGQGGIGVFEQEGTGVSGAGTDYTLDYRPFIANVSGGSFGSAVALQDDTSHTLDGAIDLDAAEDSGTGVYVSWEDEQGLVLDYSANSGAAWAPLVVVPSLSNDATQNDPVIAGVAGGNALVAYDNTLGTGDQVFVQPMNLAPPQPTTLTTSQSSGKVSGANISIAAGTIGESDKATIAGANASIATGTVVYSLYESKSCTGTVVATSTEGVAAGKPAASTPVTGGLAPGTYYWVASYSGDTANDPSTSACGSEILTVTAPSVISGSGSATTTTITLTISCGTLPCTVTVTITIDPPAVAARAGDRKKKAKIITLAKGTEKIRKKGGHKLTLKLTGSGKSYLASHSGKLKTTLQISTKTAHGTFKATGKLKITKRT